MAGIRSNIALRLYFKIKIRAKSIMLTFKNFYGFSLEVGQSWESGEVFESVKLVKPGNFYSYWALDQSQVIPISGKTFKPRNIIITQLLK